MLNRRHLRIKIMQALYAFYQSEESDIAKGENTLFHSINKMYEMYIMMLLLLESMQGAAIEKIEAGKNKRLPSEEDLRPNTKFVTNTPLRMLANSKNLKKAAEDLGVSWGDQLDMVKKIFRTLMETEEYQEYMESKERGFMHDRIYLIRMFRKHIINFELLHDVFEEKSIFWNDDLDLVSSMIIKTIKSFDEEADDIVLLELWRADEDERAFTEKLFRSVLMKGAEYDKIIDKYTANWELDRIAILDMVLLRMGVAEAVLFESIPTKVTLNEYIELSKYYSTEKSAGFVNGVLDQMFTDLKADGSIKKTGRGLIE